LNKADRILVEKVIRALTLLVELKNHKLDFIFKGGTSLLLILPKPARMSIDIDIILSPENKNLDDIFKAMVAKGIFTHYLQQERHIDSLIEKAHYKFFYTPVFKTYGDEDYILLDVLFEKNPYSVINQLQVNTPFLKWDSEPISVAVPGVECILGDKLTAFAPNSTGIPYFKKETSMSMEIIKQLFDIGHLFNFVDNMPVVSNTFFLIAENELSYRKLKQFTPADVLEDIFQTALCLSLRGAAGKGDFVQLQSGISRLKAMIFSENFILEKAIIAASKAAYLSRCIASGAKTFEKFNDAMPMQDWIIQQPNETKLNKLKKSLPEAFFYWYHALNL
jgi:hypothetical protein